jgi:pilus assembly protein CpaE
MSLKLALFATASSDLKRLTENVPATAMQLEVSTYSGVFRDVLSEITRLRPNVAVADLTKLSPSDFDLLEHTIKQTPQTSLILLAEDHSPEFLLGAMRIGVREVVPIPLANGELKGAMLRQVERLQSVRNESRSGKTLGFISAKGGSGATLVATSVAAALAHQSRTVGFFDFNMHFGDALMYLTDSPATSNLSDMVRHQDRMDVEFLKAAMMPVRPGLWASASPETPERAIEVKPINAERMLATAKSAFDCVIIDLGRSVDAVSVKAMDICDDIYIVMQYTVPSIHDTRRLVQIMLGLGYPKEKLHLVANRVQRGGDIGPDEVQRALHLIVKHQLPNSWPVSVHTANHGVPMIDHAPRDPLTKAVQDVAATIMPFKVERPVQNSWLGGIFSGRKST